MHMKNKIRNIAIELANEKTVTGKIELPPGRQFNGNT